MKVLLFVLCMLVASGLGLRAEGEREVSFSTESFGGIPVIWRGRMMPLDSAARHLLLQFSGISTLDGQPARTWLARVFFEPESTRDDPIFLIENPEVAEAFGLDQTGRHRYTFGELEPFLNEIHRQAVLADQMDEEIQSPVETEFLRVYANLREYLDLTAAFLFAIPRPELSLHEPESKKALGLDPERTEFSFIELFRVGDALSAALDGVNETDRADWTVAQVEWVQIATVLYHWSRDYRETPLPMLPMDAHGDEQWINPWTAATIQVENFQGLGEQLEVLEALTLAFRDREKVSFQQAVADHKDNLSSVLRKENRFRKLQLEQTYNRIHPFLISKVLYGFAFLYCLAAILYSGRKLCDEEVSYQQAITNHKQSLLSAVRKLNRRWKLLLEQYYTRIHPSLAAKVLYGFAFLYCLLKNSFSGQKLFRDKDSFQQATENHKHSLSLAFRRVFHHGRLLLKPYCTRIHQFLSPKILYALAFIYYLIKSLFSRRNLSRVALGIVLVGLLPHSIGILTRMYIMGRPPVTNLYATFLFVAWVGVLLGLIVEWFQKNGLGTLCASILGLVLLLVSARFTSEGDSMGVMIAVLDSNFWLATHVISITIGYSGCVAAGVFGHVYLLHAAFKPGDQMKLQHEQSALYGLLAFGLTFSFLGTMLGGVWADQSWGRFWGWDPKENGALLIVIWTSILFHAKLDGMTGPVGLAAGSVLGVIVVLFAWLGVNLLGVGLHSYGFTSGLLWGMLGAMIFEVLFVVVFVPLASMRLKSQKLEELNESIKQSSR